MLRFISLLLIFFSYNLLSFAKQLPQSKQNTENKIFLGGKHIILINSNAEEVFAIYYFGIFNKSKQTQKIKVPLWLPKGTSDFEPQSGFTKEEIQLSDDGSLYLDKSFKPGMNLLGLNFKVPLHNQKSIEFVAPFNLAELNLATPHNSQITLHAKGFKTGLSEMLSKGNYQGILKENIVVGQKIFLTIEGLPRPLYQTWYFFIGCACLLLLFLAFFLYQTYSMKKQY